MQESIEWLRGVVMPIFTHRLSTIKNVGYIYVIDEGRIIEQGTFSTLSSLRGSAFRRTFELQRVMSSQKCHGVFR